MSGILFCLPRYHTNAAPWMRILIQAGYTVNLHVTNVGRTENHTLVKPKVIVQRNFIGDSSGNSPFVSPSFLQYWHELKAINPDIVIVRGFTRRFSRIAAVCAILQRRKLVIYDQEDVVPTKSSTKLRRVIFRLLMVNHMTSRLSKDVDKKSLGYAFPVPFGRPEKCRVDKPKNDLNTKSKPSAFKILMVSKFRSRKGHLILLRALSSISEFIDFKLTFCGEMATDSDMLFKGSLLAEIEAIGLSGRVEFIENIPNDEMPDIYRAHDLFILPSANEPAAVSPIEAAWSGLAVIVSHDTGTRGYIPPGTPFDFISGDAASLASSIAIILRNREDLNQFKYSCYEHVRKVGNDEAVLKSFQDVFGHNVIKHTGFN